ncbi:MAG: phosphoribosyltransferase family protein [Cyanobacteria bacterium J06641_5]
MDAHARLPTAERSDPLPLLAWGHYRDRLRLALLRLKYNDSPQIGLLLGRWLGTAWQDAQLEKVWGRPTVVPIPLHAQRLNERGYNQAMTIARGFCRQTQLPLAARVLQRRRATIAQFGLGVAAREQNLVDAFEVRSLRPQRVLLVDDIYTTGSTMRAATRALQARGITVVGVVAVARAGRERPR